MLYQGRIKTARDDSRKKVPVRQTRRPVRNSTRAQDKRGQGRALRLFGVEDVRRISKGRFENRVGDQQGNGYQRENRRRAGQLTGTAIVAAQATRLVHHASLRIAGIAVMHSGMPVRMLGVVGRRRRARSSRHAVLTERHGHRCISLQREPKRN